MNEFKSFLDQAAGSLGVSPQSAGTAASALSVLGIFKEAKMDSGQAGVFVGLFMDFVTKNAGGDLVGRILDQIPDLKNLIAQQG